MKKAILAGAVIVGVVGVYGALQMQKGKDKGDDWEQFESDAPVAETVNPQARQPAQSEEPASESAPAVEMATKRTPPPSQPQPQPKANPETAQSTEVPADPGKPNVDGLTPDGGIGYYDPNAKGPEYGVDQNIEVTPPGADWDGTPGLPPEAGVDQTITVEPPGAGSQNIQTLGPAGEMPN